MKSEQQKFYSPETRKYRPNTKFTYHTAYKVSTAYKKSRQTTDTGLEDAHINSERVHAIFPSHKPQLNTSDKLKPIKIENSYTIKDSIIKAKDKAGSYHKQLQQIKKLKNQLFDLQGEYKILEQTKNSLKVQHEKTFESLKKQISTLTIRKQSLQYSLSCLMKDYESLVQQQ